MAENDIYRELAEKLKAPLSERFLAILHETFTPEEASICLELCVPGTLQDLKEALGYNEATLTKILDNLVDRGILTRGETQFAFTTSLGGFRVSQNVVGVHTGPHAVPQKVKDLWADFFYNEWNESFLKTSIDMKAAGLQNMMIPAIGALEISNISDHDLLPQENWKMRIKLAERRIIGPCGCRVLWRNGNCDHLLMTCFVGFDNAFGTYYLDKPGRLLKEYTEEETLEIVRQIEEDGLVNAGGLCYCCNDACQWFYPLTKYDRLDIVDPNRFQAMVDQETCAGCQDCIERCSFNAVEMVKISGSKKLKASIIIEKCKGCGICVVGCKQRALKLTIVRPKEYVKPLGEFNTPSLEPSKSGRRVPVNAKIGPYGNFYDLE